MSEPNIEVVAHRIDRTNELLGKIISLLQRLLAVTSALATSIESVRTEVAETKRALIELRDIMIQVKDNTELIKRIDQVILKLESGNVEKQVEAFTHTINRLNVMLKKSIDRLEHERNRIKKNFVGAVINLMKRLEQSLTVDVLPLHTLIRDYMNIYTQIKDAVKELIREEGFTKYAIINTRYSKLYESYEKTLETMKEFIDEYTELIETINNVALNLGINEDITLILPVFYIVYEGEAGVEVNIEYPSIIEVDIGNKTIITKPHFSDETIKMLHDNILKVVEKAVRNKEYFFHKELTDKAVKEIALRGFLPRIYVEGYYKLYRGD